MAQFSKCTQTDLQWHKCMYTLLIMLQGLLVLHIA